MKEKRGRKEQPIQKKFRKKTFQYNQYWIFYYTEKYADKTEKDFAVFLKARSYSLAKLILNKRVKEDDHRTVVKSVLGYMLHKNYKNNLSKRILTIEDWNSIRMSAFPNIQNLLFKKEIPRPEGFNNRTNKTNYEHVKKIGFKKGKDNWVVQNRKGTHLPKDKRKGKFWNGGAWIDWDKEEMLVQKNKIINCFIKFNNNRSKSAKHLNMSRNGFYSLMVRCETLDWWNSNYPPPRAVPPRVSSKVRSETQKLVMKKRREKGIKPFNMTEDQKKNEWTT